MRTESDAKDDKKVQRRRSKVIKKRKEKYKKRK